MKTEINSSAYHWLSWDSADAKEEGKRYAEVLARYSDQLCLHETLGFLANEHFVMYA